MTTTTTQSNFHPMRDHVSDGVTVLMNSGTTYTIKPTMRGWTVVNYYGKQVCPADQSAAQITEFIVNA
jgi:hypothetical protein